LFISLSLALFCAGGVALGLRLTPLTVKLLHREPAAVAILPVHAEGLADVAAAVRRAQSSVFIRTEDINSKQVLAAVQDRFQANVRVKIILPREAFQHPNSGILAALAEMKLSAVAQASTEPFAGTVVVLDSAYSILLPVPLDPDLLAKRGCSLVGIPDAGAARDFSTP
jgi:hypothetical protein